MEDAPTPATHQSQYEGLTMATIRASVRRFSTGNRLLTVCMFVAVSGSAFLVSAQQVASDASITVHAAREVRRINPMLFGANICWPMHTNNLDPERDSAGDFISLAPLASQLGLTTLRFPGGLWADAYRWKYAIGPMPERREMSVNGVGGGQAPVIGTDEFLRFCEAAGMRGIITVNYGLSQTQDTETAYQEAADWVEYCNAPNDGSNPGGGIDWAEVRARNGHPDPYGVPYWEIGNEIYWTADSERRKWGHTDVTTYAQRCVRFCQVMKAIDPGINVGAVAHMKADFVSPNDTRIGSEKAWTRTVLEIAGNEIDFLIPHVYSGGMAEFRALLPNNGEVGGEYSAEHSAQFTIRAKVGGDFFRDEWSRFELRIDGEVVKTLDTSSKHPKLFEHAVQLAVGTHRIGIRFINDLWVKGEGDRNLVVAGLSVVSPDGAETPIRLIARQARVSLTTAAVESDREKLRGLRYLIREVCPDRADQLELIVTEWNETPTAAGNLGSALHAACKLMMMAEEGIEGAHYWLLFNAVNYRRTELWFPTDSGRRLPRPSAFVFEIFSKCCGSSVRQCDVVSPLLPELAQKGKNHPPLGNTLVALGTLDAAGSRLGLIVVNRDVDTAVTTQISWPGFAARGPAQVVILTGAELSDGNAGCKSVDDLRVKTVTHALPVQASGVVYTFPSMSVTGIAIAGQ